MNNSPRNPQLHTSSRRRLRGSLLVVLGLIIFLTGCGPRRGQVTSYVHPLADIAAIKTLAVLPLSNITNNKDVEIKLRNLLVMQLLDTGMFNVIEPGEVDAALKGTDEEQFRGKVTLRTLNLLKERLKVDAVIVGTLEDYTDTTLGNHKVPEVTVSVRMLDINTGIIIWMSSQNIRGAYVDTILGFTRSHASSYPQVAERVIRRIVQTIRKSALVQTGK